MVMMQVADETCRKRATVRLYLVGAAALCFSVVLLTDFSWDGAGASEGGVRGRSLETTTGSGVASGEDDEDTRLHRLLMEELAEEYYQDLDIPAWLEEDEAEDGRGAEAAAAAVAVEQSKEAAAPPGPLPSYAIEDIIEATKLFSNMIAIMVYDPKKDEFLFYYPKNMQWVSGCVKIKTVFRKNFPFILRNTFPERFQGSKSEELVLAFASGDYMHFSEECVKEFPHASPACPGSHVPVLQFGSVFKSTDIIPNAIPMPLPIESSIHCFKTWVHTNHKEVCKALQYQESDLEWENLIPQVVWRGTDFGFLNHINSLYRPSIEDNIKGKVNTHKGFDKRAEGVRVMREAYDGIWPRWQGVVLTSEAELEAEEKGTLPWVNIKFSKPSVAIKKKNIQYDQFKEYGISAMGESIYGEDLKKYKYQIDLGGGGGTTWSGTMQKLAMPGLLFHHETPTKDYIHNLMKPWVHYVPVAPDLRDLKEKFDWAESHPRAAKRIADQGSDLMRSLGTVEGFGEMFDEVFEEQLRRVIDSYRPVSITHPETSWRHTLENYDRGARPIMACGGKVVYGPSARCRDLEQ